MRIDDYSFKDREMEDFKNQVRELLNFGKYSTPIVTTLPSWSARPGEFVLFQPVSGGTTQYNYYGSAWVSSWSSTV